MKMKQTFKPTMVVCAIAVLAGAAPAFAQSAANSSGQLETVTVTAERRVASAQKTSIALDVISGQDIAEQGLNSAEDVLKNVSNVEVQGAARGSVISMRGLGSDLPPGMGESAVSTNYDGVYNFRAEAAQLGYFDLERVEVLRGPQGTLYGRNAAGGVVNFVTRDPELDKVKGNASFELGNYGLVRQEMGVNMPINDTVAIRASGASLKRNGYLSDGFNDANATGGRFKVLVKPNADLRFVAGVEQIVLGGKGNGMVSEANASSGNAATRLTAAVAPNPGDEKVGYQSYTGTKKYVQADANVGIGNLTVIAANQDGKGEVMRKWDAGHMDPMSGYAYQHNFDPAKVTQDSVEVRLASAQGEPVQWVVGTYTYEMSNQQGICADSTSCDTRNDPRASLIGNHDTTKSRANFGQVTFPVSQSTRLIGGLRRTNDDKTSDPAGGGNFKGSWSSTDGKVGVEHDLSSSAMGYANYATAYRPGGFNAFAPGEKFEMEKVKSTEIGLKSRWLDNRLQLNGAFFNMDYTNYQAVDLVPNAATGRPDIAFRNVPQQKISGLETEATWRVGAGKVRASYTFLDAKIGSFPGSGSLPAAGSPLPHSPKNALKLGYEHSLGLKDGGQLILRADARYKSEQYVALDEKAATLQKGYTQIDLSSQYRSPDDKWGANFYVKNVTNQVPMVANMMGWGMVGAPRTYGVVTTVKF